MLLIRLVTKPLFLTEKNLFRLQKHTVLHGSMFPTFQGSLLTSTSLFSRWLWGVKISVVDLSPLLLSIQVLFFRSSMIACALHARNHGVQCILFLPEKWNAPEGFPALQSSNATQSNVRPCCRWQNFILQLLLPTRTLLVGSATMWLIGPCGKERECNWEFLFRFNACSTFSTPVTMWQHGMQIRTVEMLLGF